MKVELIEYTGSNHERPDIYAAAMLIFTKSTRLVMDGKGFSQILGICTEDYSYLIKELEYMAGTIPSSWEFVDFTFVFKGVTRACAQQITRTRTASFAMQSQRVTDVSDMGYLNTVESSSDTHIGLDYMADVIYTQAIFNYKDLLNKGVPPQDARGVLPINVLTNLVAKYNLRTFVDLVSKRDNNIRVQGEYYELIQLMKEQVREVYPWIDIFLKPKNDKAVGKLQTLIEELKTKGDPLAQSTVVELAKVIDLIKA